MDRLCNKALFDFIQEVSRKPKETQRCNKWLMGKKLEVYVRRCERLLPESEEVLECLDLANFIIPDSNNRGRGTATAFITEAINLNPWPLLYIEGCTPLFGDHLQRAFKQLKKYDHVVLPFTRDCGNFYVINQPINNAKTINAERKTCADLVPAGHHS